MKKNREWKFINSLWAIFTIFGIFNWISFLYVGIRSKYKTYFYIGIRSNYNTWIRIGHIYMFLFVCFFFAHFIPVISEIYMVFIIIGYFFGIIYSLVISQAYLARLNLMYNIKNSNLEIENLNMLNNSKLSKLLKEHISESEKDIASNNSDLAIKITISETTGDIKTKNKKKKSVTKQVQKIDINNADEIILSDLSGFNIILAKKIISEKRIRNGFKTIDELEEFLHLQPHITEQLKKSISFGNIIKENYETSNKRIIDL